MTTTDEHDREAGRQLAWLLAVVTVLAAAGVIWLGSLEPAPGWALWAPVGLAALTAFAFWKPIIVIRLVTGRFTELLDLVPEGEGQAQAMAKDIRPVVATLQEGTPLEVMAAEGLVESVAGRKRLGKALMLAGAGLTVPAVLFLDRLPEGVAALPVFAFVGGLVIWYRTL